MYDEYIHGRTALGWTGTQGQNSPSQFEININLLAIQGLGIGFIVNSLINFYCNHTKLGNYSIHFEKGNIITGIY